MNLQLDLDQLHQFYGDSHEDILFILREYCQTHAETIRLFTAAANTSLDALSQCLHCHSSAYSYVGFPQLYDACKTVEAACANASAVGDVAPDIAWLLSLIQQSHRLATAEAERRERLLSGVISSAA